MDEFVALKCPNCGASDLQDAENDMVRCPSCGSVQARVNAKKYMEQAKAEIMAEVSKLIPAGISISQTETMDPIARHNIFQNNVRSNVDAQYREYKFGYTSALNHQLIAVPFRTIKGTDSKYDSKQLRIFDEKVKSVFPLAVDDENKAMLNAASAVAQSYASLLNSISLLEGDDRDRYLFMANNYRISSDVLKDLDSFGPVKARFDALAVACEGFDNLMNGKTAEAKGKLERSLQMLNDVKKTATESLDYGAMASSVAKEIVAVQTGLTICDVLSKASNLDVSKSLEAVKDFMDEVNGQEAKFASLGGQWTTVLKRAERSSDLFEVFAQVADAKSGASVLRVAKGSGEYYMPMWAIDLEYSFVTGSLFKKHSVNVTETVLVSAMFMTDNGIFSHPSTALTDIFGSTPETTFMQRVKGQEESITMGGAVKTMVDGSAVGPVPAASKIVIPVTTGKEAEMLCKDYLDAAKSRYPKLRMGNPVVNCLVFVPCEIDGTVRLSGLGGVAPDSFGNVARIQKLSI